jgi:hypothetical protein
MCIDALELGSARGRKKAGEAIHYAWVARSGPQKTDQRQF